MMFRRFALGMAAAAALLPAATLGTGKTVHAQPPAAKPAAKVSSPIVTIQTAKGTIKIKLFPEVTPNTVNNFIFLANKGYYNGKIFPPRSRGVCCSGRLLGWGRKCWGGLGD